RGVVAVALPGKEELAVPVGPHNVELLAEPPTGGIDGFAPRFGEQQGRWLDGVLRGFWSGWQWSFNACCFGVVPAEAAQVLARTSVEGQRLVAPGRARTRIDAGDVLEHVRPAGGASHFDGLAVV